MNLSDSRQVLRSRFGLENFRPGQAEVIENVLTGKNALALFPTGGGKSLCYQLPALLLEGPVLVISPLLALMRDQVDSLAKKGISAVRLDSTLSEDELETAGHEMRSGQARLIFLSPERLADEITLKGLIALKPSLVAIDEAHCFSEWGQSFRPDYRRLPQLIRRLRPQSVLALTATATRKVTQDICKAFKIPTAQRTQLSYVRPNLSYHIHYAEDVETKQAHLLERLQAEDKRPAIVYCTRQLTTETVAAFLSCNGIEAKAFNAGIPATVRADLLQGFLADHFPVIVATIAFGMGVDKSNVRSVIHYDLPRSPEGWLQESGRAGRDGQNSFTEVIASAPDLEQHRTMTLASKPSKEALHGILRSIFCKSPEVLLSPYLVTTTLDVSRQVLDTVLMFLEIEKFIQFKRIFHRKLRLQAIRPVKEIQNSLPTRSPLRPMIGVYGWQDLEDSIEKASEFEKLTDLLDDLELGGDLIVRRSHQLHFYKVKKQPESLAELELWFQEHFDTFSESELERIGRVEKVLTSRRCIRVHLLLLMGEKNVEACGRCSRCLGDPVKKKLPGQTLEPSSEELGSMHSLVRDLPPALRTPVQLSRFLLGIASPAVRQKRLYQREEYGLLSGQTWSTALTISSSLLGR